VRGQILAAWFDARPGEQGKAGIDDITGVDARHRR